MSFTIDIGYTTETGKKVNRSFNVIQSNVSISPLSVINQLHPVFVVDYNALYLGANYISSSFLGRKYFCTVSVDTAGRCVFDCSVDHLAHNFGNCDITVTRNGGIGKPTYIPDNKLPILPNKESITSTTASNNYFTDGLTEQYCYLVTVINGGAIT